MYSNASLTPMDKLTYQLFEKLRRQDSDELTRLINECEDINVVDKDGWSPVMAVLSAKSPKVVDFLKLFIAKGADIKNTSHRGESTLHSTVRLISFKNFNDSVDLLVENGADISAINRSGRTPFMLTANGIKHPIEKIRKFFKLGIDINHQDKKGNTLLISAIVHQPADIISTIITEFQPDLDIQNKFGNTALFHAMDNYRFGLTCMECLVDAGAKIEVPNKDGDTALERLKDDKIRWSNRDIWNPTERKKLLITKMEEIAKVQKFEQAQDSLYKTDDMFTFGF